MKNATPERNSNPRLLGDRPTRYPLGHSGRHKEWLITNFFHKEEQKDFEKDIPKDIIMWSEVTKVIRKFTYHKPNEFSMNH